MKKLFPISVISLALLCNVANAQEPSAAEKKAAAKAQKELVKNDKSNAKALKEQAKAEEKARKEAEKEAQFLEKLETWQPSVSEEALNEAALRLAGAVAANYGVQTNMELFSLGAEYMFYKVKAIHQNMNSLEMEVSEQVNEEGVIEAQKTSVDMREAEAKYRLDSAIEPETVLTDDQKQAVADLAEVLQKERKDRLIKENVEAIAIGISLTTLAANIGTQIAADPMQAISLAASFKEIKKSIEAISMASFYLKKNQQILEANKAVNQQEKKN